MPLPLAAVYRNLAHLHQAGLAWPAALEAAVGNDAPRWRDALDALAAGRPLAEALSPRVPPLDVAGLRAGEASGRLTDVLRSLAERHEERTRRDRERRAALLYPLLVAHVAALLLPVPDLVAGRVGAAVGWALLILVPMHAVLALARAARRAAERDPAAVDAAWVRLLRTKAAVEDADARALTALGWLHDAGVPLLEALPLAARAGAGGRVGPDLADALEDVRAGRALTSGWRRAPAEVRLSLATAEAAGALSEACARAATALGEDAALRRKRFAAVLPAAVTLVLGAVIAMRLVSYYARAFEFVPH